MLFISYHVLKVIKIITLMELTKNVFHKTTNKNVV